MTVDLWEKAETELAKTFFYSPGRPILSKFLDHSIFYFEF
jgi:hypothetical protein